jgi:phage host-nuclease inhibitor protein Gam
VDYTRPADVHSLEEMDHHVRKVRELRGELARLEMIFRAEMIRMQDRWNERERITQAQIDWHLAPIESYHRAHPKDRTIAFSHGDSKLRISKAPKVSVTDIKVVREWAESHHPEVLGAPSIMAIRKVVEVVEIKDGLAVIDPGTGAEIEGLAAFIPDPTWNLDTEPGEPW